MSAASVLTLFTLSTMLASGAEMRGGWSASAATGQRFSGSWTAEAGGATGTWTLYDAAGKILLQGGWSVSKSPNLPFLRILPKLLKPVARIVGAR